MLSVRLVLGLEKTPVGKVDVGGIDLEQVGGELLRLGRDPFRRHVDGRSADGGGARAAGALAEKDLVGIALHVMDLVGIEAEAVAHDLLEDGLVALALGDAAREQRDGAGLVEPDLRAFETRRCRPLDGVGEADAAQLAVLARLRAALFEARDVGELERHVHALLELAAVVGERERRLERHGVGRNVISPPQLGGIDPELVGGEIDKPLDHIGGLGAPVPAIGPNRIGVREHGRDIGMHGGNAIDPASVPILPVKAGIPVCR